MKKRTRAYLFLITATFIWGASAPIIKFTLSGLEPFVFLTYRFLISGILGLIIITFGEVKIPNKKFIFLISAIYGFVATTLALGALFIGIENSSVLDLALIGNSGPLLIMLGGWFFFKEIITKREKRGTMIALIGTAIVVLSPLFTSTEGVKLTGNLFLILFLILDSSGVLISKYLERYKVDPVFLTNFAFIVAALTLTPITALYYSPDYLINNLFLLDSRYLFGVFYMAVISGNLAYVCFIKGVQSIEVSEAGLFAYLQPLISTPLAVLWLGESITATFIIGAAIIASGLYIAETKR